MPSDIDDDPPISHAVADGWANFAKTVLPSVGGNERAQAHIAFHFGAMYVLQIAQQVIADRSSDELSVCYPIVTNTAVSCAGQATHCAAAAPIGRQRDAQVQ